MRFTGAPTSHAAQRAHEDARQLIAAKTSEIERLAQLADGAKEERYLARAKGDEAALQEATDDEQRYRSAATAARAELESLLSNVENAAPPTDDTVQAALSTLEELAAALQHRWNSTGLAPREIHTATYRVLGDSLRLTPSPKPRRVRWTAVAQVPLSSGGVGTYTLTGEIATSTKGHSANADPAGVAERFLRDNDDLATIGDDYNIDGTGKKNSHLVKTLKSFLSTPHADSGLCVPSTDQVRALLDAPPSARRVVHALITGQAASLIADGFDPEYIALMKATYLGSDAKWRESWTSGPFVHQRRLLSLILQQKQPGAGVLLVDAQRTLGISYEELVALGGTRNGVPPAIIRNWIQRTSVGLDDRRLMPVPCPWSDCLGNRPRRRRRDQRQPFATHFLHVPEVPAGLLCPTCLRSPYQDARHAAARFPSDYLELHRRRTVKEDGTRIGTRTETADWAAITITPVV